MAAFGDRSKGGKHGPDVRSEHLVARVDVPIDIPLCDVNSKVGGVGDSIHDDPGANRVGGIDTGMDVFDVPQDI